MVVDANDGIIATAGIVEGFSASGATGNTVVIAAVAALVAGGLSLGGGKYTEFAAERDARRATIEEERRQITDVPDVEQIELAELYVARGLSPELARQVAAELMAHDALAAHVEAEHGISMVKRPVNPILLAGYSAVAFFAGACVPLLAVLLAPNEWRIAVIFVAVMVALCITSIVSARAGRASVGRTIARTLIIGVLTMLIGLGVGDLFD